MPQLPQKKIEPKNEIFRECSKKMRAQTFFLNKILLIIPLFYFKLHSQYW